MAGNPHKPSQGNHSRLYSGTENVPEGRNPPPQPGRSPEGSKRPIRNLVRPFYSLLSRRVKPYYLFQGDLASGTKHLRVNLEKGIEMMETLKNRLSALALPHYALDLPGGGGKTNLGPKSIIDQDKDWYYLQDRKGATYRYPVEHKEKSGLNGQSTESRTP
jgi:hypothetical protein